ncbi:MAG: Glucose 1-dehydrogenase 2 [candidate division BRC1 bacterium ADurb.BinA364]|nr:MAG: Glucose 1-dehydrogenase 2 [candidate division BRC1 bacterium ADurb.BinA364]
MLLEGKKAVVTGGGRGIGRAIALAFAREGADVCVAARSRGEIESAAEEIRQLGRQALAVECDVADAAAVEALAAAVREGFGRLDILLNNAGGGVESKPVLESDPQLWIRAIHVNAVSAYLVSRALLPLMIESGGGAILNMGSGLGHQSKPGNSSYNAGKAAMWMFTRCLAEEVWASGVSVNEIVPGPVLTRPNMRWRQPGATPPFAKSEFVKQPEDVAPLAVWLASQYPRQGPTAQSFSLCRRPT